MQSWVYELKYWQSYQKFGYQQFTWQWLSLPLLFLSWYSNWYEQNRSTEGCSKLKSPETRQVQERFVSTLEHLQVQKWDRTRCPEEYASSVGMPHSLQMFYGNLAQLRKKSNSVIRSRSIKGQKLVQWLINVLLYMVILQNVKMHSGKGNLILFWKITVPTIERP